MTGLRKNNQQMCMSTKERKTAKETSIAHDIRKRRKNEEQEVQNTLTLKSGTKRCTRKCQQFQEYEYYS